MALPYTLDQLQARLTPVFSRNSVRRATLFGSYSQGTTQKKSINVGKKYLQKQ